MHLASRKHLRDTRTCRKLRIFILHVTPFLVWSCGSCRVGHGSTQSVMRRLWTLERIKHVVIYSETCLNRTFSGLKILFGFGQCSVLSGSQRPQFDMTVLKNMFALYRFSVYAGFVVARFHCIWNRYFTMFKQVVWCCKLFVVITSASTQNMDTQNMKIYNEEAVIFSGFSPN